MNFYRPISAEHLLKTGDFTTKDNPEWMFIHSGFLFSFIAEANEIDYN